MRFVFLRDFPAKIGADLPEVLSGWVSDREGISGAGVRDGELPGMKEQAPDAETASEKTVVSTVTVFDITDNRV